MCWPIGNAGDLLYYVGTSKHAKDPRPYDHIGRPYDKNPLIQDRTYVASSPSCMAQRSLVEFPSLIFNTNDFHFNCLDPVQKIGRRVTVVDEDPKKTVEIVKLDQFNPQYVLSPRDTPPYWAELSDGRFVEQWRLIRAPGE